MNNAPKVSVIVPCYNVEEYLTACLESVENQTFEDFEVIIINDGSTDSSGVIAKRFTEKNANFRYYETENRGLCLARNYGIDLSQGEYLAFIDSDDTISPYFLEKLYNAAVSADADIACCNYNKYYNKDNKYYEIKFRKQKTGDYTNIRMMKLLLNDWTVRSYVWNKLYRRTLFTDNGLYFPDPNVFFEDIPTVFRAAYYAKKITAIPDTLYNYSIRPNSIMTTHNVKKYNDYALAYYFCHDFAREKGLLKKLAPNFLKTVGFVYCANWYKVVSMHFTEKRPKGLIKNLNAVAKTIFRIYFSKKPFLVDGAVPYPIRNPEYFLKTEQYCTEPLQQSENLKKEKVKQ